jgi:hypothetical protein
VRGFWLSLLLICLTPSFLLAQDNAFSESPTPPNFFAQQFYLTPDQRLQNRTTEVRGFVFVDSPNPRLNSKYAIVTDFAPEALKTRVVPGINTPQDAQKWIDANLQIGEFQSVDIKKLPLPTSTGETQTYYWVGQKGFSSLEDAQAQIALTKAVVESQGLDFTATVKQAQVAFVSAEPIDAIEIKTPAQFQKEEELALKFFDQLDIGNEIFGPFQGTPSGEKITWQSFGETSWRLTNLENPDYKAQVGFWTNRIVLKGIKFPLNTIDPFVEATASLDSTGTDFKSNLQTFAGIEWRPLARNTWLTNFRPGGMPLLDFVKSYRFVLQYGDRRNIKDEIEGSKDWDLQGGVTIFYEWGIDLPPANEGAPSSLQDYVRRVIWGEYFGSYLYNKTNFSSENKFDAFIANSSILLGVRLPGIPLPQNPLLDKFVLMPYLRFEHVNNSDLGSFFQNRYVMAAGARWMPFNNYRFKENEWLYKTKIFAEYVGVRNPLYPKKEPLPTEAEDYDLRFGVNISSRRF